MLGHNYMMYAGYALLIWINPAKYKARKTGIRNESIGGEVESYIGCQPIVDRHGHVFGHEFHCNTYTCPIGPAPNYGEGFMQSARVLVSLLSHHNIPQLSQSRNVFIKVPSGLLQDEQFLQLVPDCAVLDVYDDCPAEIQSCVVDSAARLKDRGIGVAIDDEHLIGQGGSLCHIANYIKVDAASPSSERLFAISKTFNAKILAKNVDTAETNDLARRHGAHYFQGSFLNKPSRINCNGTFANLDLALKLLDLLDRNVSVGEIEEAIRRAPNIMVRLLTYANSPLSGSRKPMHSVREAIAFLGYGKLYTIVVLMLYVAEGGVPQALIQRVLYRGKLMELVGTHRRDGARSEAPLLFLVGLLSMFEDVYPIQLVNIVEKLKLPERAASALLDRSGEYGALLSLVESCSKYDLPCIEQLLDQLKIDANSINNYQFAAIEWSGISAANF